MKMKQEKMRKIGIASALGLVVLVVLGLYGASNYMLNYSLNYPKEERMTAEHWKNRMKNECPWMIGWMDSVYQHHCVKDTFVTMPSGYKAHAIYLYAPKTTEKTAVVVHGYQVRSEGMLHIAYLYNHDMGYNVLLPDLYDVIDNMNLTVNVLIRIRIVILRNLIRNNFDLLDVILRQTKINIP